MIKLFATDIDHTLYSSELGYIPQENIDAVNRLIEKGITICLASSRGFDGIMEYVNLFNLKENKGYAVVNNGAYVVRLSDGKVLANEAFSKEEIEYFYNKSKQLGLGFGYLKGNYSVATSYCKIIDYNVKYVNMDGLITNDIMKFVDDSVSQLQFFDDNLNMYEYINNIDSKDRENYNFNVPQSPVIDISLGYVNKQFGISRVLEDMGITEKEVAATGDNDNDIPMLKAALISGCVANGSENAKRAATYVVESDRECGVAHFIDTFIIGE